MMAGLTEYSSLTAVESVKQTFGRIDQEANDLFTALHKDRSLERARLVDEDRANYPLAGVPFAVSDDIMAFGSPTTAGYEILEGFTPPYQAEVVERLESLGAICVGKVALGGDADNPAAQIAELGVLPFVLSSNTSDHYSDTSRPSGPVVIKPSYGLVSRYGLIARVSSMDAIGCWVPSLNDLSDILSYLSGANGQSTDWVAEPKPVAKVGVVAGPGSTEADFVDLTKYEVEAIDLPLVDYAQTAEAVIAAGEISSNLARLDGIHFGRRAEGDSLDAVYSKSRSQGLDLESQRQIVLGSFVLSAKNYDTYYLQSAKIRSLIIQQVDEIFKQVEVLLIADPKQLQVSRSIARLAGLPLVATENMDGDTYYCLAPRGQDFTLISLAKSIQGAQS